VRIESQALCLDPRGVAEVFLARGFARHERSYMTAPAVARAVSRPVDASVRSWRPADRHTVTEMILSSYKGTIDGAINCQYRTRDGCADLVEALTETEWCGQFLPDVTRVAVERASGRGVGVAIATRVSPTTVHIGQISVHPRGQGRGIGAALVRGVLEASEAEGVERVTLAVTRANETALRLYERAGFVETVRFPIFIKDPSPLPAAKRR
jgi:ribosomal protein S18 acetylase RimI-like enzyme